MLGWGLGYLQLSLTWLQLAKIFFKWVWRCSLVILNQSDSMISKYEYASFGRCFDYRVSLAFVVNGSSGNPRPASSRMLLIMVVFIISALYCKNQSNTRFNAMSCFQLLPPLFQRTVSYQTLRRCCYQQGLQNLFAYSQKYHPKNLPWLHYLDTVAPEVFA